MLRSFPLHSIDRKCDSANLQAASGCEGLFIMDTNCWDEESGSIDESIGGNPFSAKASCEIISLASWARSRWKKIVQWTFSRSCRCSLCITYTLKRTSTPAGSCWFWSMTACFEQVWWRHIGMCSYSRTVHGTASRPVHPNVNNEDIQDASVIGVDFISQQDFAK